LPSASRSGVFVAQSMMSQLTTVPGPNWIMLLAEPRLRPALQRKREGCWIIVRAMAENSHAVRPGEHEIQPALHCCYRVPAPALGRELRMDAVEASAMRHEYKPPVLRPQSEVSLVGKGRGVSR
jgi:hypothetical protein